MRRFDRYMARLYPGHPYATLRHGRQQGIFGRFPVRYARDTAESAGELLR